MFIEKLLQLMAEKKASDLFISAGSPICIKIQGTIMPINPQILDGEATKKIIFEMLTPQQEEAFVKDQELNFSKPMIGLGNFRVNCFWQKGTCGLVIRYITADIPKMQDLNLPPVLASLIMEKRGLILVVGATGSGKSTTLASMVDLINAEREEHILTIEDPIEFLHRHKGCIVNQREIGADATDFAHALKAALRQDPDVILVGEMRDLETISTALTAAETGHLVFATLHTQSTAQTVDRIIDVFPPHQQPQVRAQLSLVLQGVISQQLIPRRDGKGRALACEVMIPNPAIRNLIREEKVHQIYSQMQVGQSKFGMQTMSQTLIDLVHRHLISPEEALGHATELEEVRTMLGNRIAAMGTGRRAS